MEKGKNLTKLQTWVTMGKTSLITLTMSEPADSLALARRSALWGSFKALRISEHAAEKMTDIND